MTHHRKLLLLLAIAAILVSGTPIFAAPGEAPQVAGPGAGPALEAGLCPDSGSTGNTQMPKPSFMIPPIDDFILCTCSFCRANPEEYCQISPSGYSILCKDWAKTHC